MANFFRGSDDYEGDEWGYPDVRPYTPETMRQVFEQEGVIYSDRPEFGQPGSGGAWFTAERPK